MEKSKIPTKPVAEQERAVDLFESGGNLRIDAYAGTGKTTTLALLARRKPGRGLYLAFNRAIAHEARERFPAHVKCATTHSIAFRGVRRTLRYPEWKLTEAVTPNRILDAFSLPAMVSFRSGLVLDRRSYASILRGRLLRFLQSSEEAPDPSHVTRSQTGVQSDSYLAVCICDATRLIGQNHLKRAASGIVTNPLLD